MKKNILQFVMIVAGTMLMNSCTFTDTGSQDGHEFNGNYTGDYLNRVAFPIGGIGAGMVCLEGTGAVSHVSVYNKPDVFNEPSMFAAISLKDPISQSFLSSNSSLVYSSFSIK